VSTWESTTPAPIAPIGQPEIVVGPDEHRVVDAAVAALMRAAELYVRNGALVEVITDEPETRGVARGGPLARIVACAEARVRELLAREATWLGGDGGGGQKAIHPPQWVVRAVMARGQWPGVRPLDAVATAPTMRTDGSILTDPGYDLVSRIYLVPSVEVSVAERPTLSDARGGYEALLDVVCDFPASAPAGKAAWAAGVITAAVRTAIEGPTPMIIVDANQRGAGKSLSVDVAAIIATGRPAARMIYSRDDAEIRKMITSVALVGDQIVLLDNVSGELGCASLDAALTADTWRDRILGSSTMTAELPLRITWWATGNGLVIGADLVRRALLVRLEPQVERPEERTGWRYPRLLDHVRTHRSDLLAAALTIPRAYVVAGRPDQRLRPMGSYERWSDLVRSSLVWAGAPDPCDTILELRASDARGDALRGAIEAWPSTEHATAAELVEAARPSTPWRAALLEWVPPKGGELPTARALGYALRSVRRRIVSGRMIDSVPDRTGTLRWRLVQVGAGDAGYAGHLFPPGEMNGSYPRRGGASPASPASPAGREPGEDDGEGASP